MFIEKGFTLEVDSNLVLIFYFSLVAVVTSSDDTKVTPSDITMIPGQASSPTRDEVCCVHAFVFLFIHLKENVTYPGVSLRAGHRAN